MSLAQRLLPASVTAFLRAYVRVCLTLCRVMLPVIALMKLLQVLGAVEYAAAPLGPIMGLIGLPPETGLVWASAMLGNLYTGMVVLQAVSTSMAPLSQAQVTVLAVLMLIAHNMVVECRVAQSCGVSFWGQFLLRLLGGLACAWLLWTVLDAGDLLAAPARLLWTPPASPPGFSAWVWGEAKNLGYVFCVIFALMVFMRALQALGVADFIEGLLAPVLRLMGIGRTAAAITVVGMTMGLAYGGGLILHEVAGGKIARRDVFAAVSLMSLSHALIEDTLLMTLIGASPWGTLGARLVFSVAAIALLTRVLPPGRPERAPAEA